MKKFILPLLLAIASTTAMADTTPKADIIRTTYGDFDAQGQLLSSNETALKAMNFKKVEKKANKGDKDAQFYLAKMYELGIHTQKDQIKAMEWYKKSAENGNANAMNNYANYLIQDEPNSEVALSWLKKASELNQPHAKMNLAVHNMFENQEMDKGEKILFELANNGFAPAYYALSDSFGEDIIQDENGDDATKEQVYFDRNTFLIKSAEMGFAPAQKELAFHLMTNAARPDPKDKERAKEAAPAYQWASRACANGVQISCELKQGFIDFTTTLLNENQLKCEQGNKEACEDYEIGKALKEEIKKYQ